MASRIIQATRSTPVTASVTGCSTCRRALTSRNDASRACGVVDELDGARRAVVRPTRPAAREVACSCSRIASGRAGCGCLLDDLLVAALQRAVPITQGRAPSGAVAEDLHLDVAGVLHVALDEAPAEPKLRSACGAHPARYAAAQLVRRAAHLHADTAAAAGGLEHHRVADHLGGGRRGVRIVEQIGAGEDRHTGSHGRGSRGVLGPELAQLVRGRGRRRRCPARLARPRRNRRPRRGIRIRDAGSWRRLSAAAARIASVRR